MTVTWSWSIKGSLMYNVIMLPSCVHWDILGHWLIFSRGMWDSHWFPSSAWKLATSISPPLGVKCRIPAVCTATGHLLGGRLYMFGECYEVQMLALHKHSQCFPDTTSQDDTEAMPPKMTWSICERESVRKPTETLPRWASPFINLLRYQEFTFNKSPRSLVTHTLIPR